MEQYDTPDLRRAIASHFSIDLDQLQLIRSYSNLVYDAGDLIVRLTHSSLRPVSNIEAELFWLSALQQDGLSVVKNLTSKAGNVWEIIPGKQDDFFTALAFEKLAGERISQEEWTPTHFERLGALTAQLHLHSLDFSVAPHIHYPQWDEIIEHQAYQHTPTKKEEAKALFAALMKEFATYPKTRENYGLIHYDIHHGNYFAQPEGIVLFDFEMVCYGWYMHDVAAVLYYACNHPASRKMTDFEATFLQYFWKGYERYHRLPVADRAMIQPYLLYRDLMVYGYLGKVWADKELTAGDQAYLERLRKSIDRRKAIFRT
ncbi:MAG: phosphotransferase [Bacteroidota bacterium]